jgi:hypothetical protein
LDGSVEKLNWQLGGGFWIPLSCHNYETGDTAFELVHESGLMSYVVVNASLPDQLHTLHLMYLIHKEMERLSVTLAAHAMYPQEESEPWTIDQRTGM